MSIQINEKDLLIIVDPQYDFMPGGNLPVPEGDQIIPVINDLLANNFKNAVVTQDWHPNNHQSFASQHKNKKPFDTMEFPYGSQTLWNDHCVQGTHGAKIHEDLNMDHVKLIIRKGANNNIDSYSAFKENDKKTVTGLKEWILAMGYERLFFCGLALDFCVAASAMDSVNMVGIPVYIIEDATRGLGVPLIEERNSKKTTIDVAKEASENKGIIYINSNNLNKNNRFSLG